MAGYNKVVLVGRLGKDPELKVFQNGGAVANFSLAVPQSRIKNQQSGEYEEKTCWIDCKAFNSSGEGKGPKNADFAMRFLAKGGQVMLTGKLIQEQWKDNNGNDRFAIRVEVAEFVLLGNKEQNVGGGTGNKPSQQSSSQSDSGGGGQQETFDDIPF